MVNSFFIVLKKTSDYSKFNVEYGKCLITLEKLETNPHIHIILQTEIKKDTLRKKLKNFYQKVHLKECKDLDKSINYILKDFDVVYNSLVENLPERIELVKNIQEEIKLDKSNYGRYLCKLFKNSVEYELCSNVHNDFEFYEYQITLFLLDTLTGDYKGFDKVIISRYRHLILHKFFNYTQKKHLQILLPNNIYVENHYVS